MTIEHAEKAGKQEPVKEAPKNISADLLKQYNDITVKNGEGYFQALKRTLPDLSARELSELALTSRTENGNKSILNAGDHIHLLNDKTMTQLLKGEKDSSAATVLEHKFANAAEHKLPELKIECKQPAKTESKTGVRVGGWQREGKA